ncbi:TM0106 family RecB-like putative nuclease [Bradyrhizobium japonicum]|uniref:TM0106 family RecB-like putative nuclease n=1 Tax=Bradyrhizobium japonicum TaxID=375 RepID=UPI001B8A03C4|nr:TM0106 family RecB-like putative nuclease [Bradyrhizobium japonicum]MBR0969704.1 TM0106 family RecB-like putative nuclease [Bradyrhizobium japonicum]
MAETRDAQGAALGQESLNGDVAAHDKSTLGLSGHLTPTQLAAHLACPHLTQLERQRREGLLQIEFSPDPRLEALRERGRQHETAYVEKLRSAGRSICDLRDQRDPAATRRAMEDGFDAIVQATLSNEVFSGIADLLLRVDSTTSSLPGYVYEPADTKLSLETKPGTILQLCTYAELLKPMQGVAPDYIHVVTPIEQETYRTAKFAAYYRLVRARLLAAVTATPPPSTYPHPVAHCDICIYWRHCDRQRRVDDHPSLIAAISSAQVREFERQGLPSVATIAQREGRLPDKPIRGAEDTYRRLGQQARLQVVSRGADMPQTEALALEPGRGLARLPEPSVGDIFLDFEGDPFVAPHGLEYLTGVSIKNENGEIEFNQRWALHAGEEKAALEAFIDFALARVQKYPGAHVYHYGAYEPSALKRLSARHATRGSELDQLLRGRRFVDLHATVREGFRIGVERYGLKELEALHGFQRRLDLRDASLARRDLELALELGDTDGIAEEIRERVAAYNGDDCLSTESLRGWLEHQRDDFLARGQSIVRPVPGILAPSEKVSARDQRIEELREALRRGLPADPEARTADESARLLLAAMLGYYRQEEKNAWWEFFRLRDLPNDEHLDERQILAGLEFVERLPKQGRERNARCRFRFPIQEAAIDVGDTAVWPVPADAGQEPGTVKAAVEALDLDDRTIVLSISEKAMHALPASVFKDPVVGAKPLEESLLAFAEHVRDNGFDHDSPYAAACELLRARPPRRVTGAGEELRRADEDTGPALVRLSSELDGGVLPVQGPPGAGKTTLGAKAILALAAAGKKIGITAVSHKVIDNLLVAVRKADNASSRRAQHLHLVHKDDEHDGVDGIEFAKSPGEALDRIAPGTIVGGTAWLWAHPDAIGRLDVLVIDEAGQMALAQALAAARAARNLVLLGDPQQLEQPTRGAHEDGADVAALVHLLGPAQATLRAEQGLFLDRTYRLHPTVCAFTSEAYYEGRLQSNFGLERQRIDGATPFVGAGLFLVEVTHQGNQAQSLEEVDAVVAIARSLLQPSITWTNTDGETRPLEPKDILVVAPYNSQVSALRRALADVNVVRVGTVDKFQGQEAPVVIYSCASSSPEDAPRGMAFLYDPHRFNVATSRACCAVILVANPRLFEPDCRTPEQMGWASGFCRFEEMAVKVQLPEVCAIRRLQGK